MTFAQLSESSGLPLPFLNAIVVYGPMALMLYWFMWRAERKSEQVLEHLAKLSHRINGITKAMLVDVISRDNYNGAAREAAQRMLGEMEASDSARESR